MPSERRGPRPVHWIQAKYAREHLDEAERGRIVRLDGDLLTVRISGQLRHYQVHDPERLVRLIEQHGRRVLVQERWSLLRLRNCLIAIRPNGFRSVEASTSRGLPPEASWVK